MAVFPYLRNFVILPGRGQCFFHYGWSYCHQQQSLLPVKALSFFCITFVLFCFIFIFSLVCATVLSCSDALDWITCLLCEGRGYLFSHVVFFCQQWSMPKHSLDFLFVCFVLFFPPFKFSLFWFSFCFSLVHAELLVLFFPKRCHFFSA